MKVIHTIGFRGLRDAALCTRVHTEVLGVREPRPTRVADSSRLRGVVLLPAE